jgi:cold shock CspA family protein
MRIEGTIAKWNNDRGFGFIAPAQGGPDVFVHISAFPQDGIRPSLGDRFSFEIDVDPDGKRRGVRLLRCRRAVVREPPPDIAPRAKAGAGRAGKLIFLLLVAGLAWYGFGEYSRYRGPQQQGVAAPVAPSPAPEGGTAGGREQARPLR